MKIFNDVRSRSPLGEVGQKPVDTPLLAAGSSIFKGIGFILTNNMRTELIHLELRFLSKSENREIKLQLSLVTELG